MVYTVLNKQDFEQELEDAGKKLVIIDFFANWCGPCRIIEPQLRQLSLQYADHAKFLKVNVDNSEDIVADYNITSMPTFVLMKDGHIIDILVGGNAENLLKSIEKFVGDGPSATAEAYKTPPRTYNQANLSDLEYALENELVVEDDDQPDAATSALEVILDDQM